ncbi:MAG: hypothetical protein M3362_22350 [Acidobacteriota bacterium]|nr:hypothetical protein [Acidobacteriota bacterium]
MRRADGKSKRIACPRCGRHLRLEDFEITEHTDGTWTAEPSVICTREGCGFNFFIIRNKVEAVQK